MLDGAERMAATIPQNLSQSVRIEGILAKPRDLPADLLSSGRYWFTTKEFAERGSPGYVYRGLEQLKAARKVFSPTKSLWVIIPPEYRSWGVIPGEWFIDPMMKRLRVAYYISLLTAASIHGASHQAPQVTQAIVSSRHVRDRSIERVRLRFYYSSTVARAATQQHGVKTGFITIATRETTVFDLVHRPTAAAGFDNIATIVKEIGELNGGALADVASRYPRADSRRVGWLLERFAPGVDLGPLRDYAQPYSGRPQPLDQRGQRRRGKTDRAWGLIVNTEIDMDL